MNCAKLTLRILNYRQSETSVEDLLQSETSTETSFPSKGFSHQNKEEVPPQYEAVRELPQQCEAVGEPSHLKDSNLLALQIGTKENLQHKGPHSFNNKIQKLQK